LFLPVYKTNACLHPFPEAARTPLDAPMLGTWINVGTVIVGTVAGRAAGGRLTPSARSTLTSALGCITIILGIENALKRPPGFETAAVPAQAGFFLVVLLSVLLGSVIGEWLNIEGRLQALGRWAERRMAGAGNDFGKVFVTTSLLFCVGPLTILGCLQDGLRGDYSLLATKAVMDGFAAVAFAAAMGWGVLVSALTVLVVQGALTLSAGAIQPWLSPVMLAALTAVGGIILLALGIRLLELKEIRVANMVPALLLAPVLVALGGILWPGVFYGPRPAAFP
jgi:uncharacterized membrane protein YqgA involved in biofilm formation